MKGEQVMNTTQLFSGRTQRFQGLHLRLTEFVRLNTVLSMKPCQHCGQPLENSASVCPACGHDWKSSVRVTASKPYVEKPPEYLSTPLPEGMKRIRLLLRLGFPAAALIVAWIYNGSFAGAAIAFISSAVVILLVVVNPFIIGGFIFGPLLGLYGLKFSRRDEPEMDLRDPDVQLFLTAGIPIALVIVALLAWRLKS
jgi:hypothetical protein